jgi:hypothetical protein
MPSAEHYRQYAARCHQLARIHSDKEWTGGLVSLAYEYEAKAAEVEVGSRCQTRRSAQDSPPSGER